MTFNNMAEIIKPLTDRDRAQITFEGAKRKGFVEDFVERGSGDLGFMGMPEKDQELWNKIAKKFPSLIGEPPFFD